MNLEFSGQIFEKYPNIKFHENPSSGSWIVQCERMDRRTDRHDEANSRFRNFENAPKNNYDTKFEWLEFYVYVLEVLGLIYALWWRALIF
jgi:hypothetical protein